MNIHIIFNILFFLILCSTIYICYRFIFKNNKVIEQFNEKTPTTRCYTSNVCIISDDCKSIRYCDENECYNSNTCGTSNCFTSNICYSDCILKDYVDYNDYIINMKSYDYPIDCKGGCCQNACNEKVKLMAEKETPYKDIYDFPECREYIKARAPCVNHECFQGKSCGEIQGSFKDLLDISACHITSNNFRSIELKKKYDEETMKKVPSVIFTYSI